MTHKAINLQQKLALFNEQWQPKVVTEMNDYQFKLVKVQGDFIRHDHQDTDETFMVLDGQLRLDFRDGVVYLSCIPGLQSTRPDHARVQRRAPGFDSASRDVHRDFHAETEINRLWYFPAHGLLLIADIGRHRPWIALCSRTANAVFRRERGVFIETTGAAPDSSPRADSRSIPESATRLQATVLRCPEALRTAVPVPSRHWGNSPVRILIVEDDEVIATTMSRGLTLHGYVVDHVPSAEAAAATLALLSAEQAYQQALLNRTQAQASRYADTVALFQALGRGCWNADPARN